MFITTPNDHLKGRIWRRNRLDEFNGRAVRPGFDPLFITGYNSLWPGYQLRGLRTASSYDITVAPLDAPERIPAGYCSGYTRTTDGTRFACQEAVGRP